MNNEVRKETNLENYKEELKKFFITDGAHPVSVASEIVNKLDKNMRLRTCNNYYIEDILDWMAQPYKEPILDDVEKSYLRSVIKPFRGRVNYIYKTRCGGKGYFIRIVVRSTILPSGLDSMYFPVFTEDTMYKGMVLNKTYTLKELGL